MSTFDLPYKEEAFDKKDPDGKILKNAQKARATTRTLLKEERNMDALERTVAIMRDLREFSDFNNIEFRTVFATILFDLAEIHFQLKDYKHSEKELELLFKVISRLMKEDADRFGEFHVLAMELAARIIRSRKKAVNTLAKERLNADALLEKVNSGAADATERLVESLRKVGELMAASGAYKEALKFYADAIKFSKKRSGMVGRKEIKMTIEMAEIMSRISSMRQRAKRLLAAVLPHAIALETINLEEDIVALIEVIDDMEENHSKWKTFLQTINLLNRIKKSKGKPEAASLIHNNPAEAPADTDCNEDAGAIANHKAGKEGEA